MDIRQFGCVTALALATLAFMAAPAAADAIDGHWCYSDGSRMSIEGPSIVTPGGTRMEGDYDRHGFRYTVPRAEAGAGSPVSMVLIDDDTLHLTRGAAAQAAAQPQVWRRCGPPIS